MYAESHGRIRLQQGEYELGESLIISGEGMDETEKGL